MIKLRLIPLLAMLFFAYLVAASIALAPDDDRDSAGVEIGGTTSPATEGEATKWKRS